MYSKMRHEAASFCNFCGLFSKSEVNRKSIYVCKCQGKPTSELKFCDRCSLYLKTSIEAYRCKCNDSFCVPKVEVELDRSPRSNKLISDEAFCVPKVIEVELDCSSESVKKSNKSNKSKKSNNTKRPKSKKSKVKKKTKNKTKVK